MARKFFYVPIDTTGFNTWTGKFKYHNFFLFSQNNFWLCPSLNQTQLILCSEYIYFGYKTPLALPAMFALLCSTVHIHKKAVRIGPQSTLPENISSATMVRYQPQRIHIKGSGHLPKRLRWRTPAGNGPCRHCIPKTFCSQVGRPAALDWHTLRPANGNSREIISGFYEPLEQDFSTMELCWITSTITKDCIQDISLLPFSLYFHIV